MVHLKSLIRIFYKVWTLVSFFVDGFFTPESLRINLIRGDNESHLVGISSFCGGKALEKAKENVKTRRKKRINPVASDIEHNNRDEVMADANKFSHRHALLCLWIYK